MYTRFNLKRKRKRYRSMILTLLCVVLLAILFVGITKQGINNKVAFKEDKPASEKGTPFKFICIQTGVYENNDNAQSALNLISTLGNPFIITEGKNTRVLLGIYTEEQGTKIMEQMQAKEIPNSKFSYKIENDGLCNAEIGEIINANITILNRLCENNVKAVQTKDLKAWCKALKQVDKKSKEYDTLENLKKYINAMPDEISKDKANINYQFLFTTLKKYNVSK